MPRPGGALRSRNGCYRCRARKVKCDEAQPECERCRSTGYACPGYKPPTDIIFRSMNKRIETKVGVVPGQERASSSPIGLISPISPTSSDGEKISPEVEGHDAATLVDADVGPSQHAVKFAADAKRMESQKSVVVRLRDRSKAHLYPSVSTNWDELALCRFFSDYVLEANEVAVSPGYLNNLPKLYGDATNEIMAHSIKAVSLASFSTQARSDELLVTARKSYGQALLLVKRALSNSNQVTSDASLAGVFFLNMYEMISGDKPMLNQYGTHADALAMLLRLRTGKDQYQNALSGGIARGARSMVVFRNLLRRMAPGPEILEFDESMNHSEPWVQVGLASTRICHLIPMADSVLLQGRAADPNGYRLLELINRFQAEDHSFDTWAMAEPPYDYGTIRPEDLLEKGNLAGIPLPPVVHFYHDNWIAGFWNVYRFARMVLLQTLHQLADRVSLYPELILLTPRMELLKARVIRDIDQMVNDICSSIPYTLGWVDAGGWVVEKGPTIRKAISGYTSVWPLKLTLMVKTLTDLQKKHIIEQLAFIKGSIGIKQAKPNF